VAGVSATFCSRSFHPIRCDFVCGVLRKSGSSRHGPLGDVHPHIAGVDHAHQQAVRLDGVAQTRRSAPDHPSPRLCMKYGTSPAARRLRRRKHDLLAIRDRCEASQHLDGLRMFVRTRRGTAVFDKRCKRDRDREQRGWRPGRRPSSKRQKRRHARHLERAVAPRRTHGWDRGETPGLDCKTPENVAVKSVASVGMV
jgi:hypothetical protein